LATSGGQTSNSNWSLIVNFPDTVGSSAQFQTASWAAQSGSTGVWFKSFEGNQNPGDPPADATLSQTVASGAGTYDLTFFAKREANFSAIAMFVRLSSNAGDTATYNLLSILVPNDGSWNQYSILGFVAAPGTTSLTVEVVMDDGVFVPANPQSFLLDDFNLDDGRSEIPEPGTVLLTGVGVLCLVMRRRLA
jgi:hypothetical protein